MRDIKSVKFIKANIFIAQVAMVVDFVIKIKEILIY